MSDRSEHTLFPHCCHQYKPHAISYSYIHDIHHNAPNNICLRLPQPYDSMYPAQAPLPCHQVVYFHPPRNRNGNHKKSFLSNKTEEKSLQD